MRLKEKHTLRTLWWIVCHPRQVVPLIKDDVVLPGQTKILTVLPVGSARFYGSAFVHDNGVVAVLEGFDFETARKNLFDVFPENAKRNRWAEIGAGYGTITRDQ